MNKNTNANQIKSNIIIRIYKKTNEIILLKLFTNLKNMI